MRRWPDRRVRHSAQLGPNRVGTVNGV